MTARFFYPLVALLLAFSVATPANAITVEIIKDSDELVKSGKKAIQEGQLEKAAYYYEQALKNKWRIGRMDMIQLRSNLCVAYMYMARLEEALRQCKIGLDLLPNRWETLNNLGTVYLLQGDYEHALASYERALKMKPNSGVLQKNWEIATARAQAASEDSPKSNNNACFISYSFCSIGPAL